MNDSNQALKTLKYFVKHLLSLGYIYMHHIAMHTLQLHVLIQAYGIKLLHSDMWLSGVQLKHLVPEL